MQNAERVFEPQEVEVGNANISFVEIVSGLDVGNVVALDAYQRALTEFGDQEPEIEDDTDQLVSELTEAEEKIGQTSDEQAQDTDLPPRPPLEPADTDLPPKPMDESKSESDSDSGTKPSIEIESGSGTLGEPVPVEIKA